MVVCGFEGVLMISTLFPRVFFFFFFEMPKGKESKDIPRRRFGGLFEEGSEPTTSPGFHAEPKPSGPVTIKEEGCGGHHKVREDTNVEDQLVGTVEKLLLLLS